MTRTPCWDGSVRAAIAAVLLVLALPLMAAAPAADSRDEDEELKEVQVTGTRIQSPNVTSANPITSITGEEMRRLGIVNVADALLQLVPQNISTYSPFLAGDNPTYTGNDTGGIGGAGSGNAAFDRGSLFIGNTIANLRGMDPMFGSRTLTLVDGRRTVSTSNQADVVDLNVIPSNLLERMDVVTGGASATYGSGAMAGVVNLVLARRLTGVNIDLDYGVNEAGDGGSPHASVSGGMPLFGGKGHVLLGMEWQDQKAIRDCAAARSWCAESRAMFTNSAGSLSNVTAPLAALPGYADVDGDGRNDFPARFEMANVRYSQFAPAGTIYMNDASRSSGFRFTDDGTGVEEYAYGFRGGTGNSAMNGDGPLVTSGTTLRPSSERKSAFSNFEYDITSRTTAYLQASYATTESLNINPFTQSTTCVRFNTTGVAAVPGGSARAGDVIYYGNNGESFTNYPSGTPTTPITRTPITANTNFRAFVGVTALGAPTSAGITARSAPYIIAPGASGSTDTTPPVYTNFSPNVTNPVWQNVRSASGSRYWNLVSITLTANFDDPGAPAVLPQLGRNSYAFLSNLSPEALYQVQNAFNNSTTAGSTNQALVALYGGTPCSGFTAMRKVWNPQIQQSTTQDSTTWRTVAGVRGRFGSDWRWEGYYQYGATDSKSTQYNVATNLSFNFAMDAVIDNRAGSPTFGTPICRITRDGVPVLDSAGRPMSDPEGLAALAAGCKPLNVFGTSFSNTGTLPGYNVAYDPAELQRQALDYAFKDNISDGANSLQTLSFNTSGTIWQGWAGPLTGAFGLEFSQNTVDNKGSRGPYYQRADFSRAWGDAFGGKTRTAEGYTELDLPLVTGLDGINLWSINAGLRYTSYYNKGGAGTTGQSATQGTLNWKFQTVFEPFDWVRLRVTRSRDVRAAGYRDLFLNQPGIPDQASGVNPWRERSEDSDENQRERWGFIRVGNADLTTEKSNTLTLGMVLSPGSWAQGARISVDYYTINVKDAIYTPFGFESPITACWENSGNIDFLADPDNAVNGLFNENLPECRELTFGTNLDGSRDLTDILSYNASRPTNGLPYQRRGIDFSLSYMFPLNRAIEALPGSLSLTVRGTRALESSGIQQSCGSFVTIDGTSQCVDVFTKVDLVGQIRSSVFIPGVAATPKWTGNVTGSYLNGNFSGSLSARYIGGANFDNTWTDDPDSLLYRNANGQILNGSVDNNRVDPYLNFSLNSSYNLKVANTKQFQVFGSISNLFDKSPPFTGGGISGASAQFNDTMGRAYRMGVRLKF